VDGRSQNKKEKEHCTKTKIPTNAKQQRTKGNRKNLYIKEKKKYEAAIKKENINSWK
jgi:hypothetical protein